MSCEVSDVETFTDRFICSIYIQPFANQDNPTSLSIPCLRYYYCSSDGSRSRSGSLVLYPQVFLLTALKQVVVSSLGRPKTAAGHPVRVAP